MHARETQLVTIPIACLFHKPSPILIAISVESVVQGMATVLLLFWGKRGALVLAGNAAANQLISDSPCVLISSA